MGSLLDILGICGIFSSNNYPCYDIRFADITWRVPVEHTNDFSFPLNRWQVKDGVNTERFQKVMVCSTQNEHSYRVVLNCGLFIFIATKLLAHVCKDAADDGFDYIEAHPNKEFVNGFRNFMGLTCIKRWIRSELGLMLNYSILQNFIEWSKDIWTSKKQ